jgi:hypothetical protein
MNEASLPVPLEVEEEASLVEERGPKNTRELLLWALPNFRRFCGLLKVRAKGVDGITAGRIPMVLTPLQQAYCANRTSRDIICKPRQVYFTTLESARDVWWFLTKPGARVVLVCQSQTDMAALKDISEKFRIFFDCLQALGLKLEFGRESATEWTLPARDASLRLIQAGASEAAAAKKGRGGTVNRLHFTEASTYERAEETFNALLESVPREGSEIVNECTPNGASGYFYEQWVAATTGKSAYKPHFYPWYLHTDYREALSPGEEIRAETDLEQKLLGMGVLPEAIKWYRGKVREKGGNVRLIAQEYPSTPETCFLVYGKHFFDVDLVDRDLLVAKEPIAVEDHDQLRIWRLPQAESSYVIGADTSEGTGGNFSAACVFERGSGVHCATLHGQFVPWDFAQKLDELGQRYNEAMIAPERNNHGHAVLGALVNQKKYKKMYKHTDGKLGWLTNEVTRPVMLDGLDGSHRRGTFKTNDKHLLGQMRTFMIGENGKPEAGKGADDDLVFGSGVGWAVMQMPVSRCIEYDPYGGDEY